MKTVLITGVAGLLEVILKTSTLKKAGLAEMIDYIKHRGVAEFDFSLPLEINSALTPSTWKERLI